MNKALSKQITAQPLRNMQYKDAALRDIHFAYASYRTIQAFL
jgi:hypothetical protein